MPTRNVNLTKHYDSFIESSIATGRFSNASEAVRAGLHLLEQEEAENLARIEWLRGAAQQGLEAIERGEFTVLHSPAEIKKHVHRLRARK
ncbi:MAG TPA: type II toxin-antitoxin system ParD family antitoxin [Acidisarcina sp.]